MIGCSANAPRLDFQPGLGVIDRALKDVDRVGATLGVGIALLLDRSGALPLPRGAFRFTSVPFQVEPSMVALVMAVALFLAAAASWLPSRMVARREPAEGLRYE